LGLEPGPKIFRIEITSGYQGVQGGVAREEKILLILQICALIF